MAYQLDAFKPELWTSKALVARDGNYVMANLVDRSYQVDIQYGDVLHIPSIADLTAQSVTNDGSDLSFISIDNTTTTDLTINKHEAVPFFLTERDMIQMLESDKVRDQYAMKAGMALAKSIDTDLLGEASNASNTVGTASSDIDDSKMRQIAQALDEADAPTNDRFLVVAPSQINALRGISKFVSADSLGDRNRITKAYEIPEQGYFGEIYGIHVYTSTNVPAGVGSPAGTVGVAFQRSAIALAVQMDISVDTDFNVRSQRYDVVTKALWGHKTLRADHMVKVLSN